MLDALSPIPREVPGFSLHFVTSGRSVAVVPDAAGHLPCGDGVPMNAGWPSQAPRLRTRLSGGL